MAHSNNLKIMSIVKIWGTGKTIEKGKMLTSDKETADILVSQGKASFDPVEKTKEVGMVPNVEPPKKPSDKETADKTKGNGKK